MTLFRSRQAAPRPLLVRVSGAFRHAAPDLLDVRHLSEHLKRDLGLLDGRRAGGAFRRPHG